MKKIKKILLLMLTVFSGNLFGQSITKNDLIGIWKITAIEAEEFYKYDFKTKSVTLDGLLLWATAEDQEKTKADIKSNTKTLFVGFNENESYALFNGKSNEKGVFKVQYGEVIFETKEKDTRYKISLENSQEFTITTDENEMKTNLNLSYKKMTTDEILALKYDKYFSIFKNQLQLSKSENEEKYNEAQKNSKESEIRNARENQEKADRLSREQSNANKYYKSNISITKAIEIIREKLVENQILNIIKNEKIKSKYSSDNNLYKCTLSVSNSEEFHIRDYEGEKTLVLTIAEAESRDNLTDLYYTYEKTIENWFKNKGAYKKAENWDDRVFRDDVIKVTIHLYDNGNVDGYVLQIEFSAS